MKATATDLKRLIQQDVALSKEGGRDGGEYAGPCPFCGGDDRFRVWPNRDEPGYWCRKCDASGDAIEYVRERDGVGYVKACEQLGIEPDNNYSGGGGGLSSKTQTRDKQQTAAEDDGGTDLKYGPAEAPGENWQQRGREFVEAAQNELFSDGGAEAMEWLKSRGFTEETIQKAGLGYHPEETYEEPEPWGQEDKKDCIWLPRGIVIPWEIEGQLWRVNIRRPLPPESSEAKYIGPAGYSTDRLYGADRVEMDKAAVIVEGELDALIIQQVAGEAVAAVATGATSHARSLDTFTDLAGVPEVLVSFDSDEGGEQAAEYWTHKIDGAHRWRPYWDDVNGMYTDGGDLRNWLEQGLKKTKFTASLSVSDSPEPEGVRGTSGMSGSTDQENEQTDEQPAWAVLESDVLNGEKFLLVRDDLYSDDELQQRVTEEAREQAPVTYRMSEMNSITAAELTDEDKRDLHALKKQFGGDVLGEDPAGEAVPVTDISAWVESMLTSSTN